MQPWKERFNLPRSPTGRDASFCARFLDGSGFLTLRFFYFSAAQQNGLARGMRIHCFGEIRRGPFGLEIVHPEYRRVQTKMQTWRRKRHSPRSIR